MCKKRKSLDILDFCLWPIFGSWQPGYESVSKLVSHGNKIPTLFIHVIWHNYYVSTHESLKSKL